MRTLHFLSKNFRDSRASFVKDARASNARKYAWFSGGLKIALVRIQTFGCILMWPQQIVLSVNVGTFPREQLTWSGNIMKSAPVGHNGMLRSFLSSDVKSVTDKRERPKHFRCLDLSRNIAKRLHYLPCRHCRACMIYLFSQHWYKP